MRKNITTADYCYCRFIWYWKVQILLCSVYWHNWKQFLHFYEWLSCDTMNSYVEKEDLVFISNFFFFNSASTLTKWKWESKEACGWGGYQVITKPELGYIGMLVYIKPCLGPRSVLGCPWQEMNLSIVWFQFNPFVLPAIF